MPQRSWRWRKSCHERGAAVAVFPELGVSGYAISDLLHQSALLDAVEAAIAELVAASADLLPLLLVGAPLRHAGAFYNCALAIHRGAAAGRGAEGAPAQLPRILRAAAFRGGRRHGRRRDRRRRPDARRSAPTCCSRPRTCRALVVHAEICEDLWIPVPPSSQAALAGATVLANLSASNITIGKAETRRLLCASQSARCVAAYLYAAAGAGESTTDLAWDGQASIFENGAPLAETERFPSAASSRWPISTSICCATSACRWAASTPIAAAILRVSPHRLPAGPAGRRYRSGAQGRALSVRAGRSGRLEQDCYEAYNIQVSGLAQRLRAIGIKRVVIGVSGGLNSTQALIVCAGRWTCWGCRAATSLPTPCRASPPPLIPRPTQSG